MSRNGTDRSREGTAETCADASRNGNESFGWDTQWNSHEMRRKRYAKNRLEQKRIRFAESCEYAIRTDMIWQRPDMILLDEKRN